MAGLTRENVASHLQKHRMRLKKEEGGGGGGHGGSGHQTPVCSGRGVASPNAAMADAEHGEVAAPAAHHAHKRHEHATGDAAAGAGEGRRPQRQRRGTAATSPPSEMSGEQALWVLLGGVVGAWLGPMAGAGHAARLCKCCQLSMLALSMPSLPACPALRWADCRGRGVMPQPADSAKPLLPADLASAGAPSRCACGCPSAIHGPPGVGDVCPCSEVFWSMLFATCSRGNATGLKFFVLFHPTPSVAPSLGVLAGAAAQRGGGAHVWWPPMWLCALACPPLVLHLSTLQQPFAARPLSPSLVCLLYQHCCSPLHSVLPSAQA